MLALAINGSPRKNGNTHTLLEHTLAPIQQAGWDTEILQIGGKPLSGCRACMQCMKRKDERCAVSQDVFNDVFPRMLAADAIILGSPTYFTDVTAEMKALIDRSGFVAMANGRKFLGKIGASVVAVRRGGATHAFDSMNHLFQISGMVTPGSLYWNMAYGMHPGEVENDAEGLANMRHLGEMIVWLGNALAPHKENVPRG
jgi:Multimeric flavodoxin WrbA